MSPARIKSVRASIAIDSRAEKTIYVEVVTDAASGMCSAPRGAPLSVAAYEAPSYPPGGVYEAIRLVNEEIAPRLKGLDARRQEQIDQRLKEIDGTPNFRRIGGNTSTAVSIAVARAAANGLGLSLYRYLGTPFSSTLSLPLVNLIGGGPHAIDGVVPDFQEHHLVPVNAKSMRDVLDSCRLAYQKLREKCMRDDSNWTGGMDDEGAWAPNMTDWRALELMTAVANEVDQEIGVKMRLGIDCAAEHLWNCKRQVYDYKREHIERNPEEQKEYISKLIESFPIYYVEDIARADDFETFAEITRKYGNKVLVCGDDLLACNIDRLATAAKMGACNSLIIKVNMTGTLTDTYRVVRFAVLSGYMPIQSRRSGETEDTTIADLAVAWNCPLNKFAFAQSGAPKQNRLLRIEEELDDMARMPTLPFL
jgi:enolase